MKKQTLIPDSRPVQKQQEQFNNIPKSSNFIEKGMRKPETSNTNFRQDNVQKPSILQDQSKGFNNFSNNTRPDTRPQTNKTNTPSRKNYNDAELEEARESLRLLKMKNRMNQQGSKPRIENAKDEGFMDNINAVNNNYRKAFKPSVSQDKIVNNDSSKNVNENLRQNNINSVQNKQNNNTKNKENFNNPSSNNNYGSGQAQKYSSQTNQQQYDDFQGNNFNPKSNNRPTSSVGNNNNKTNAAVGNRNNQFIDINAENDPMEKPLRGNNNMNNYNRGGKNNNFDQNDDNFVKHNSKNNIPKTSVGNYNNYEEDDNYLAENNNRNKGNNKFNQQAPQKSRGGFDGMRNNNLNIPDNEYNELRMFNDDKIGKLKKMKQQNEEPEYNYGRQKDGNSRPGYGNNNAQNNKPKVQEKLQNFDVEEVEDDRPAFNQKNKDFEEMLEEEEIEEEEDDGSERIECDMCGRRFKPESLQKHKKVCKKVFIQKRKKFDMKKQRVIDEEHKEIIQNAEYAEKKGKKKVDTVLEAKKKANKEKWKKQSEEFRRMLRGGKKDENDDNFVVNVGGGAGTGKGGATAMKPAEPTYNDDLTHCSICNRRYNEDAYKKHLPMCERKKKEAMIKNGGKNPPANGKLKK